MDANVGEAVEEFMHFAEGLKHQTAKGAAQLVLLSSKQLAFPVICISSPAIPAT